MIYPSGRAVWLAAAGVLPALLVAVLFPAVWYFGLVFTTALLGFALVDAVAGPALRSIGGEVSAPPRVAVGGGVEVTVLARASGAWPGRIEVRLGHDARLVAQGARVAAITTGSVAVPFRAVRRGIAGIDRLWLRWRGPFGLVWKQRVVPVDLGVAVMPDLDSARDQAISLLQRDALIGDHAQRLAGQGREFDALRDYQPGMGRRFVDWKRSARHGRLLAKGYQVEQNTNIVLAIDSGRLMCEPLDGVPKIDRAVTAGLLMALLALNSGDLVSLFSFDARPRVSSGAIRGTGSFPMVQRLAAEIDYSSEETNFTLALATLAGKLNRRSLIVVFTDLVDAVSAELMLRAVARLTGRHTVLFLLMRDAELEGIADAAPATPDDIARAVTAGTLLRERDVVIGRLRMLGAHVIEADHREIGTALVERYLMLKRSDAL